MPISRPLLIALAVAVLALVGFYATQGSRDAVDSAPVAPAVPAPPAADSGSAADEPAADGTKADGPSAVAKVDETAKPAKQPQADKAKPGADKATAKADEAGADAADKADAKAKSGDRAAARKVSGPVAVERAIDRKQRVVLFFGTPRGADDRATARAVVAQRGRGVVVVLEPLANLSRYRDLIGGLGISQAPAVVIVGRDGAARLVEGYVDSATLAQDVADAR